jgi:uncharacterized protein YbcC (UPF0753/DUF2309 family)
MGTAVPPTHDEANGHDSPDHSATDRLKHAIEHAGHLLPAQGPINVFIHHNTLHAFEHLTFEKAVRRAAEVFGCQPYLSEDRYRSALAVGRIRVSELRTVLAEDLRAGATDTIAGLASRADLRLAMLESPVVTASAAELNWFVAETGALKQVRREASSEARLKLISETRRWIMRDVRVANGSAPAWVREPLERVDESEIERWGVAEWEAFALELLWSVSRAGAALADPVPPPPPPVRHRDLFVAATGFDPDLAVNDLLTRFCAAFLDQGIAHWPLPEREQGFFHSFCALYRRPGGPPAEWLRGLSEELARIQDSGTDPVHVAATVLTELGVTEAEWEDYLARTVLALRGWGGMVVQVEDRPDKVAKPIPKGSLLGFVAVRLLLDRYALAHAARVELTYPGPLAGLRSELMKRLGPAPVPDVETRAFPVFQLAQLFGWTPQELGRLAPGAWRSLIAEVEAFDEFDRRRVFHLAYEARFVAQSLDALVLHERRPIRDPKFQVFTCIDDREESFRRHLEEVEPGAETLSMAGFFAVAMYYRGADQAHFAPLCPVVLTPRHWVEEEPDAGAESTHARTRWLWRMFGKVSHAAHVLSRTAVVGSAFAACAGVLAAVPLVSRVLLPRQTGQLKRQLQARIGPPRTRLRLERSEPEPGPQCGRVGYNVEEMAGIAERVLRDTGLIRGFSRLILTLGHGSSSVNNPHESAYDCGACGGSPGAPNGRAIAEIFNDPRVRAELVKRGITIPDTTRFVGGFHNTCDDTVTLADLDRVPETHRAELAEAKKAIDEVCRRNAHERARRFMSAPLSLSTADARKHVDARSQDLAQPRPELGHATNALCHVGRRERTRGLFFDRRAFLNSYDAGQDTPDSMILTRTLAAIYPVCGGISLEYFFSHVDSPGYGCGSKLPHNITSLLGVMDGAASDLRTGLPWQMVEIHEPVRLLIICETTPEKLAAIMALDTPVGRTVNQMTRNGWVYLAAQDPNSQKIWLFRDGEFREYKPRADELPSAPSSIDWYRGWRDFLEFAEIGPGVMAKT